MDEILECRREFARRQKKLGPVHPDVLSIKNRLAGLLESAGEYDEAETLYRQTLETCRRVLGNDHEQTLLTLHDLGYLLSSSGDFAESAQCLRAALDGKLRVSGKEDASTMTTMDNLAHALLMLGNDKAAEALAREVLELRERTLGPEHPDTLVSVQSFATHVARRGDSTGAERLFSRAYEGLRRTLGTQNSQTIATTGSFAEFYMSIGKPVLAEPLYREAAENSLRLAAEQGRMPPVAVRATDAYTAYLQRSGWSRERIEEHAQEMIAGSRWKNRWCRSGERIEEHAQEIMAAIVPSQHRDANEQATRKIPDSVLNQPQLAYDQCLNAFADCDYETSAALAMDIIAGGANHELMQMLVISLQRLGQTESVEEIGPRLLAATASHPWYHTLLKLTLGQADPAEVVQKAHGDVELCQAHYYAGSRFLFDGQMKKSRAAFDACRAMRAQCLERIFAELDHEVLASRDVQHRDANEKTPREIPDSVLNQLNDTELGYLAWKARTARKKRMYGERWQEITDEDFLKVDPGPWSDAELLLQRRSQT